MRMIRYLPLLALALFFSAPTMGQDDFNPTSPAEPGAPPTPLVLLAEPATGGRVSGAGLKTPASNVTVSASANTNYSFVNWTDTKGNVLAETRSYTFAKSFAADTLVAHFSFVPSSPGEPVPAEQIVYYQLTTVAGYGGWASGGGRYQAGTNVTLKAGANTNYDFVNWTNEAGEVVSTSKSFSYTTKTGNDTLTAHFAFNPSSPSEPSEMPLHHKVWATCTEGGTINSDYQWILSGKTFTLKAYPNDGYAFRGWYLDGELYTTLASFSYTMGDSDLNFEARFEFDPSNPAEPTKPTDKQYAFYLMSAITYPGGAINCPLYLTNIDSIGDMTFQLTFPEQAQPDWATLVTDAKASGYDVAYAETDSANVYKFSFIGSTIAPGNTRLLTLRLNVPDTVQYSTSYPLKINQVSVAQMDGSTVTASTRNGRLYIYKLGDSNGDGTVDVTDKVNIVKRAMGQQSDDFIEEVSDVNFDGTIDISDAVGVIGLMLKE